MNAKEVVETRGPKEAKDPIPVSTEEVNAVPALGDGPGHFDHVRTSHIAREESSVEVADCTKKPTEIYKKQFPPGKGADYTDIHYNGLSESTRRVRDPYWRPGN